ncbi:MAG: MAPEG family protein [Pseudomonadota bacterium]
MPVELQVLAYAGLLQGVQFVLMAVAVNLQVGPRSTTGPRDEPLEVTGIPGRLMRAMNNHFEALILFTLAVVVVVTGAYRSAFTGQCAWVYLIARILYVPAYVSGVPLVRSLIWFVGFGATMAMLLSAVGWLPA